MGASTTDSVGMLQAKEAAATGSAAAAAAPGGQAEPPSRHDDPPAPPVAEFLREHKVWDRFEGGWARFQDGREAYMTGGKSDFMGKLAKKAPGWAGMRREVKISVMRDQMRHPRAGWSDRFPIAPH